MQRSKTVRVYNNIFGNVNPPAPSPTPVTQPLPGAGQVPNYGGGYAWKLDKWKLLERFLILGTEGGTYYTSEQKLTKDNALSAVACIKENGERVLDIVVDISQSGRANKNDPALFVLALCSVAPDLLTRQRAYYVLTAVARTSTHLFHFLEYRKQFAGWSAGLRNGVTHWYNARSVHSLATQLVKYRQRDGWTHADVLRLGHVKPPDALHSSIYRWAIKGSPIPEQPVIQAYEEAKNASESRLIELITKASLPWEAVPTDKLTKDVWSALLHNMQYEAMTRNLATMTVKGVLSKGSSETTMVCERFRNADQIRESRLHPIKILNAMMIYAQGHSFKGEQKWTPVQSIVDALSDAFYASFGNVTPTLRRLILGIDISGSMSGSHSSGLPYISCATAAAVLALVTANVEKDYEIFGFDHALRRLNINPNMRLDAVMKEMGGWRGGSTDCSKPIVYATQNRIPAGGFLIYTDNETNSGIHPSSALRRHREVLVSDAKMAVIGMVANPFSIADSNDAGMMDFIGFDMNTPQAISQFIIG